MRHSSTAEELDLFKVKLQSYKEEIDEDIEQYAKTVRKSTLQHYGKGARLEVDAYLDILSRGGKRVRGALVMLGYEMSGGQDRDMAMHAARALEMLQAYILIIDDIQDRSILRRGAPAAHVSLGDHHEKHEWAGDSQHFGVAMALNSALSGAHAAQMILANMNVDEELRLKVLSIVNRTMLITAHGQTNDILNEVKGDTDLDDVDRVMEWKAAHYTFLNPLHVGMVLAGAECDSTDAITDFAIEAGKAFQITDDILGVFGNEIDSGKSPFDDIREGKRTLLTVYALEHSTDNNKNFLIQMLGNPNLNPDEFKRCKEIIVESGALEYAKAEAQARVRAAQEALDKEAYRWTSEGVKFLRGLADYILVRTS